MIIQEISALKTAEKNPWNSVWCMSRSQVKARYATIVIKFSSFEYPLKELIPHLSQISLWPPILHPQALKQVSPPKGHIPATPFAPVYSLYSWRPSCLCQVGRESRRGGDTNNPTPFSSTSVLNRPWTKPGGKAWRWLLAYRLVQLLVVIPAMSARSSVKTPFLSLSKCGGWRCTFRYDHEVKEVKVSLFVIMVVIWTLTFVLNCRKYFDSVFLKFQLQMPGFGICNCSTTVNLKQSD